VTKPRNIDGKPIYVIVEDEAYEVDDWDHAKRKALELSSERESEVLITVAVAYTAFTPAQHVLTSL